MHSLEVARLLFFLFFLNSLRFFCYHFFKVTAYKQTFKTTFYHTNQNVNALCRHSQEYISSLVDTNISKIANTIMTLCYVTNRAFVEFVKCPSLHDQFLDCFCTVLSVIAFLLYLYS